MNDSQRREDDLTNLRNSLEQQLGSVERKLEDALHRLRRVQEGSVSDLSDFNEDASTRTWNTEYTLDGLDENSVVSNNTDISVVGDEPLTSPVNIRMSTRDLGRRSNASESTGGNSPMFLFSSNAGNNLRVNVQGNASLSYSPRETQSHSGSETSGFIAESSGYGQSPVHDLDRIFSETENESNVGSGPQSPGGSGERRPASPEPPYVLNNSSDDDANSIVEGSAESPAHSRYSFHTMSDSDTADAVRDILDIPPPQLSVDDCMSAAPFVPTATSLTPTSSVEEHSDADDLKGFTSSDDVSDIDVSDSEQLLNRVQPFYSNDMISDNDDEFVHNSPSESAADNSDEDSVNNSSRNSASSVHSIRSDQRGFLSSDSDSDNSETLIDENEKQKKTTRKNMSDCDSGESTGNESKGVYSGSLTSNNMEDEMARLHEDFPSPRVTSPSPRSRKQSELSEQIDVQSLLDHFAEENLDSSDQPHGKKDSVVISDEQVEKSLDKFTEALEEMADKDEMESRLRNHRSKYDVASNDESVKFNHDGENSDAEKATLMNDNTKATAETLQNNLKHQRMTNQVEEIGQIPSTFNAADSTKTEILSEAQTEHIRKEYTRKDVTPATGTTDILRHDSKLRYDQPELPSTSREQDRHIELLEEQYALKRENKNLDVERYVSHVQRMMSSKGNDFRRNAMGNKEHDRRLNPKRKSEQQPDATVQGMSAKKAKYEIDKSDKTQRNTSKTMGSSKFSSQSFSRNETVLSESTAGRPTAHSVPMDVESRYRRGAVVTGVHPPGRSFMGATTSSRNTADKKHTWDPKNLNISLNVAINLDKAAKGKDQVVSTSALPLGSVQQSPDRPGARTPRRSAPPILKQRERSVLDRVTTEGGQVQHKAIKSERSTTTKCASGRSSSGCESKVNVPSGRSASKASSTVSKPPTASRFSRASGRPRRRATPSTFTRASLPDSDTSSEDDVNWEPVGDEPSDISISSSENEDEENTDYKLKIPIPTATLLEKYQDCDDSDDSWEPPV